MATFLEYKNEVSRLMDDSTEFAISTGYEVSADNIRLIKDKLSKMEMMIVVCGEIKRGKSSLLSAFLEEKDLFPIDVNVATNTVTVVRYGEKERIVVVFEDGNGFEEKEITREEIVQFVTEQGNRKNEKKVSCMNIEIPNNKLKNGLVFVDTPGVGSMNIAHSEVTYGFLPNADILLFVSDALSPLTEPELKFLQTATKYCKNVIFPLTKRDKMSDYMNIVEENIRKICEFTSMPENDIRIIPISSTAKLNYLENQSPIMLKSSNFKELENAVWALIYEKRSQILIVPLLSSLFKEMTTLRNNLKIKYLSLTQDNEASKSLENELNGIICEKQRLLEDCTEWKMQLNYELSIVNSNIINVVQKKTTEIENHVADYITKNNSEEKLLKLSSDVNGMLSSLVLEARDTIVESTDEIINKTMEKLGLLIDININSIDVELDPITNFPKQGKGDKAIQIGRNMMMKSGGAATIAGLAGGIAGGLIGFFIGGPAGAFAVGYQAAGYAALVGAALGTGKGLIDGIKSLDYSDISRISQLYSKYTNKKAQEIINMVNIMFKQLSFSISNELNNKLKEQKSMLDKNISDMRESLKLNKNDALKSAELIKSQLELLSAFDNRICKLIKINCKDDTRYTDNIKSQNCQSDDVEVNAQKVHGTDGIDLGFLRV